MGGMNSILASFIALSAWQTLSGGMVAIAANRSMESNGFQRRAFYPRKYQAALSTSRSHTCSIDDYKDEYDYLEPTIMDCTNDSNHEEEEPDSEARFAYQLGDERDFFRHCESSYLLRDVEQTETKVIPSSSSRSWKCGYDLIEV